MGNEDLILRLFIEEDNNLFERRANFYCIAPKKYTRKTN
jgi:hypothetical protein